MPSAKSDSLLLLDLLQFLSSNESDLSDDKSEDDGSDSGSAGMCAFSFCFEEFVGSVVESVGHVCGVGSGVFVPKGIESTGDVVLLVIFKPKGVKSKGGRLIGIFWRPKS